MRHQNVQVWRDVRVLIYRRWVSAIGRDVANPDRAASWARGLWDSPGVSEGPWWHPGRNDEWDEPLPTVVILEPDYGAELPLTSEEEGMLDWQQTRFSPQLLDQLVAWQEAFEAGFHHLTGWRSPQLRGSMGPGRPANSRPQSARNSAAALNSP